MDDKDNVLLCPGSTVLDIPCERVISALQEQDIKFTRILVIGFDEKGELYCASHSSSLGEMLLLMERARQYLLNDVETE